MELHMTYSKKTSSSSLVTADLIGSAAVVLSGVFGMVYVLFITFGGQASA
jgi:hypothetical protein